MNSALYQCRIFHKRLRPVERQFAYSVFMMSLDLDELESNALSEKHWLFSQNKWNIYTIHNSDYLTEGDHSIKQKLLSYLAEQDINLSKIERITLQTFPRIFGYQFNPVSFYYIYDRCDKMLFFIDRSHKPGWLRLRTNKDFYVSPFSEVDDHFDFQIGPMNEKWSININDENDEGLVLVSTIRGERKSISSLRLSWYIIRYPLLTLRVIFLIHWHALIMWIKKLPIASKKGTAPQQTEVLRPHKSLTEK